MTRDEFMGALGRALYGLPAAEAERVMEYYGELFSDGAEAGRSEEDICAGLESPESIAGRLRAELAFVRAEQTPSVKNANTVLLVLLGLLALPIGLPLAFALMAMLFASAAVVVSIAVAAAAVVVSFGAIGIASLVAGIYTAISGGALAGLALIGLSLVFIGLTAIGVSLFGRAIPALIRAIIKGFHKLYRSVSGRLGRQKA